MLKNITRSLKNTGKVNLKCFSAFSLENTHTLVTLVIQHITNCTMCKTHYKMQHNNLRTSIVKC